YPNTELSNMGCEECT
nr:gonadotropin alpha subunit, GTH II alpha {N-terminal} [Micropogonias undulatus=Atlantic croakers, pituitary glands, Peptide Partial, 15 aa] [Micropogonias undulatus]